MAENTMKALLDKVVGDPAYAQKLETMSDDELRQWVSDNKIEENMDDLAEAMRDYVGHADGPSEISEESLANVAGGVNPQDIYRGCKAIYEGVKRVAAGDSGLKIGRDFGPDFGTGGFQR